MPISTGMSHWCLLIILLNPFSGGWAAAQPSQQLSCQCEAVKGVKKCGTIPAFLKQDEKKIAEALGFDVPENDLVSHQNPKKAEIKRLVNFLEKSDRARMFYPEFYTRATKNASVLTLKSKYTPKNPTEMDEYFRCSIPSEKYCLFKSKLKPYIGLAAKASGIDYSFLACQSYVESRFKSDAKSVVGALGYAQIKPSNIEHMNSILDRSIKKAGGRSIASVGGPREARIRRVQKRISELWAEFWKGTKKAPKVLCKNDLMCHRQAFLAQALALKTDMLTIATSTSGIAADFDENDDFRIEKMDKGDSLLLLAGSYNLGVTKTIRLVSRYCKGVSKLKKCLDNMQKAKFEDQGESASHQRDVQAIVNYVMRIRDCSQQYSAEQLDFDDDARWSSEQRTELQNQQRDRVAQCLLNPCPYQRTPASDK